MILFKLEQVGEVLQRIYDSEINIELSSFWDAGYTFKIGDTINGFSVPYWAGQKGKVVSSCGLTKTIDGLAFCVSRDFPESDFAKWYTMLHSKEVPYQSVSGHAVTGETF